MEINTTMVSSRGLGVLKVFYKDIDSLDELGETSIEAVNAFGFLNGKLVIVYNERKNYWGPPGGGVEAGESATEALRREVHEETGLRILDSQVLGFRDVYDTDKPVRQVFFACIFVEDATLEKVVDEEIEEMSVIEPSKYKEYFDWGDVGDRVMELAIKYLTSRQGNDHAKEK